MRLVEQAVKDSFDRWLSSDTENAAALIDYVIAVRNFGVKKKNSKSQNADQAFALHLATSWPIVPKRPLMIPKFSSSRAIRRADPPNRDATAHDAGDFAVARQNPKREIQLRWIRSPQIKKSKDMIEALGCGIKDNLKKKIFDTKKLSS